MNDPVFTKPRARQYNHDHPGGPHGRPPSESASRFRILLFRGSFSEGPLLAGVRTRAGASLGGMRLENANGGDLALDDLSVRLVSDPRQRGGEE